MPVAKPPITQVEIPGTSFAPGRNYPISQISEHHAVGDAHHVISKARSVQFSCTFTISQDGTIFQLVAIGDTPYTDNDYRSNGRSITIEHAGGGDFPYTEAMYQASIKLHAWLFQQYGSLNCVRHREIPEIASTPSKATACPGSLDVERIVSEANKLLKGEEEVRIGNDQGWRDRMNRFHHQLVYNADMSDAVFQSIVGKELATVLFQWSDHSNADNLTQQQVIGEIALRDNWQGQITELRRLADELGKRPTKENFEALQQQMQKCTIDFSDIQAEAEQLKSEKQESVQTGNAIIRFISDWWNARKK